MLYQECHGGPYAFNNHYSPMSNDIWSLGIILLNLATGRNPWKSATPNDLTFQAYLRDPSSFLPTVLPISRELNDVLVRMLQLNYRDRISLQEVKESLQRVKNLYSENVVFEGSMARCPWEAGVEIESSDVSSAQKAQNVRGKEDPRARQQKPARPKVNVNVNSPRTARGETPTRATPKNYHYGRQPQYQPQPQYQSRQNRRPNAQRQPFASEADGSSFSFSSQESALYSGDLLLGRFFKK